ncbi:MAG: thiamine phosphate synthase, partial [Gemmatimonadota bacterium]
RALVGTAPAIGVSAHSRAEAEEGAAAGADAVVLGPVFETASHPGADPLGLDPLRETCRRTVPVVAIGGITPARVQAIRACGAAGVAVLRGVWDGPGATTGERVAAYLAAWTNG